MAISSNIIGIVGLDLQSIAVLLGGVSAYYIWQQLTAVALTGEKSSRAFFHTQPFAC